MSQLKNDIVVTEFNTYYPDHLNLSVDNEDDWKIYARKLKDLMLAAMPEKKNSESGFRDVKEYMTVVFGDKNKKKQTETATTAEGKKEN